MLTRKMIVMGLIMAARLACVNAGEIHVAKNGQDSNVGSATEPVLTLTKAVALAQPGDTVTVHAGTYREWVQPVRGGTSEEQRITFRAAEGEDVFIKGSEEINTWVEQDDGIWKVELPNRFFRDYNPYDLLVYGGCFYYGGWHHRGDVYLNGEAFYEQEQVDTVGSTEKSWFAQVDETTTTIWANFGAVNPNDALAEINVRESLFIPLVSGINYITVDGFNLLHSANNWAGNLDDYQAGAVGPRMGKWWIIENCTISDIRNCGITLGRAEGVDYENVELFGSHIIRNNHILHCGQAGIIGKNGASLSLITGNLIEEINYRREFGGDETAGIKVHRTCDLVISNNLIRGVYRGEPNRAAEGIWIDYANQGTRITGNIFYNTDGAGIHLEMNHGPILVDNNIFFGTEIRNNSEAVVVAHNLMVNGGFNYTPDTDRKSNTFVPHTTQRVMPSKPVPTNDEKFYNNIIIRNGLDRITDNPGCESDYNLLLEGASPTSFGDANSLSDDASADATMEVDDFGITVSFVVSEAALTLNGPQVGAGLFGVFEVAGQTLEDQFSNPIEVTTDYNGAPFSPIVAGPLATLKAGENIISWRFKNCPQTSVPVP